MSQVGIIILVQVISVVVHALLGAFYHYVHLRIAARLHRRHGIPLENPL